MKKRIVMLIFACVCVMIFIVQCEDTIIEPPDGYVSGYVYEAGTTNPIDSVKVYIPATDYFAFTDETGYYILSAFPVSYTIVAEKNGYEADSVEARLFPKDTITQDFELQKE